LTIKKLKKLVRLDQLQQSVAILAQWQRLVASNKALNLLYWVMRMVSPWRIAMAIQNGQSFGYIFS
jgi:hypothetical protein